MVALQQALLMEQHALGKAGRAGGILDLDDVKWFGFAQFSSVGAGEQCRIIANGNPVPDQGQVGAGLVDDGL